MLISKLSIALIAGAALLFSGTQGIAQEGLPSNKTWKIHWEITSNEHQVVIDTKQTHVYEICNDITDKDVFAVVKIYQLEGAPEEFDLGAVSCMILEAKKVEIRAKKQGVNPPQRQLCGGGQPLHDHFESGASLVKRISQVSLQQTTDIEKVLLVQRFVEAERHSQCVPPLFA